MVVLGSGGHTAEMMYMLETATYGSPFPQHPSDREMSGISKREERKEGKEGGKLIDWEMFAHTTYVASSGDRVSATKAREFEERLARKSPYERNETKMSKEKEGLRGEESLQKRLKGSERRYGIYTVPRARRIHQSLLTAPWSCLVCGWACLRFLLSSTPRKRDTSVIEGRDVGVKMKEKIRSVDEQVHQASSIAQDGLLRTRNGGEKQSSTGLPDLILLNGPATATIMVIVAFLLKFVNYKGCSTDGKLRCIYIESWARIYTLSLSGKIMQYIADRVIVQWPNLGDDKSKSRVEYHGALCL